MNFLNLQNTFSTGISFPVPTDDELALRKAHNDAEEKKLDSMIKYMELELYDSENPLKTLESIQDKLEYAKFLATELREKRGIQMHHVFTFT